MEYKTFKYMPEESRIICITGPSAGAGKTTIAMALTERFSTIRKMTTTTTRSLRGNEENGKDYYSITEEQFLKLKEKEHFLEHNCLGGGSWYGLTMTEFINTRRAGKNPLHVCDINGVINIKKIEKLNSLSIFIDVPIEELEKRMRARNEQSEESIQERLRVAREEIEKSSHCDHVIPNPEGELEQTINKVGDIVQKWLSDNSL